MTSEVIETITFEQARSKDRPIERPVVRRSTFLLLSAAIGSVVGLLCVLWPTGLLASKGLAPDPVADIWLRQTGVLLLAMSLLGFLVRRHPLTPTLRAVLWALALAQIGLLVVEVAAWAVGVIPGAAGIIGNCVVHLLLATGFCWFARQPDRAG